MILIHRIARILLTLSTAACWGQTGESKPAASNVLGRTHSCGFAKEEGPQIERRKPVAKSYSPEERQQLLDAARGARSPTIYPALMLAFNAGMRSGKIRNLRWNRVDLKRQFLVVGAGEGPTSPLNAAQFQDLKEHSEWYTLRFESRQTGTCSHTVPRTNSTPAADRDDQNGMERTPATGRA